MLPRSVESIFLKQIALTSGAMRRVRRSTSSAAAWGDLCREREFAIRTSASRCASLLESSTVLERPQRANCTPASHAPVKSSAITRTFAPWREEELSGLSVDLICGPCTIEMPKAPLFRMPSRKPERGPATRPSGGRQQTGDAAEPWRVRDQFAIGQHGQALPFAEFLAGLVPNDRQRMAMIRDAVETKPIPSVRG
jgi:hypothetical protein